MTLYSKPEFPSQSASPVVSKTSLPNSSEPLHNVQQRQASRWGLPSPRPLQRPSFFTSFPSWLTQLCWCCLHPCFAFPTSELYSIMVSVLTKHKLKNLVNGAFASCCELSSIRQFSVRSKLPIISL